MNIVVVGGGSAGWLTALYAKKVYENSTVTLVESEEYGVLGAGEGGTPQLLTLLEFLDISVEDIVYNCSATVKNGIKFTNWSKKDKHYYHPFGSISSSSNDYNFYYDDFFENNTGYSHIYAQDFGHSTEDYVFIEKISEQHKIPNSNFNLKTSHWGISIHFDARKLAIRLRQIAESRGVVRKEGLVQKLLTDPEGYITEIKTNKETIKASFVFDCSGFRRLVIGNFYKQKWKSYSKHLPAKKAIPFFLEPSNPIPPYTESIAMDYGWMWKIPLQHRYGCGYVFDTDYISEDKAKEEVVKYLGYEVEFPTVFSFNPGCFENVWHKNVLAVGLSAGFLEPLEATSLWQSINTLKKFFSNNSNILTKNKSTIEKFNKDYVNENQEYVDLVYTHYITSRTDTNFWKDFLKNNETPEFVKYIIEVSKERPLTDFDFSDRKLYSFVNYFYVLLGNEIITKDMLQNYKKYIYNKTDIYKSILENQKTFIDSCVTHNQYLDNAIINYEKN